eukprot:m.138186 g.138186  ORF g.138186 m.138186 type:complete len:333 (+) comp13572_c0_seq1:133-1131(+)
MEEESPSLRGGTMFFRVARLNETGQLGPGMRSGLVIQRQNYNKFSASQDKNLKHRKKRRADIGSETSLPLANHLHGMLLEDHLFHQAAVSSKLVKNNKTNGNNHGGKANKSLKASQKRQSAIELKEEEEKRMRQRGRVAFVVSRWKKWRSITTVHPTPQPSSLPRSTNALEISGSKVVRHKSINLFHPRKISVKQKNALQEGDSVPVCQPCMNQKLNIVMVPRVVRVREQPQHTLASSVAHVEQLIAEKDIMLQNAKHNLDCASRKVVEYEVKQRFHKEMRRNNSDQEEAMATSSLASMRDTLNRATSEHLKHQLEFQELKNFASRLKTISS